MPSNVSRFGWIARLAGAFGLVCCASIAAAQPSCRLAAAAVVPVSDEHGRFVIDVDINSHPARLVLATGYFRTGLDLQAARRLGVALARTDREIYGVGGNQHMSIGTVGLMHIGQLKAEGLQVVGADMWGSDNPRGWDGRYGMNMMAAYDIDLDVVGGHVVFYEAHGNCGKPTVTLAPDLYEVPLEPIREDRQADIMIKVDGRPIKAMLDSGLPVTTMYRAAALRLGVDLSPLHTADRKTLVGPGKYPVGVMEHVFSAVSIGSLQINNMKMRIVDQETNGIDRSRTGSHLPNDLYNATNAEEILLGADFMRKFHLWISHSSQTLILQYPPLPSKLPG